MAKEIIIKMPIVIKVGMRFKTVEGAIIEVIKIEPEFEFPIAARFIIAAQRIEEIDNVWSFITYTADGKFYNNGRQSEHDLLAYIP